MRVELVKSFTIEAAHRTAAYGRLGAHLHGHTFRIDVVVEGEVEGDAGWLIDYGEIKKAFRPIAQELDHTCLNDHSGLEDASLEAVADWIRQRLAPALPMLKDVRVRAEGDGEFRAVELSADRYLPRRLGFSFAAAQSLPNLPEGHPCRKLHGHTYRVEVGAGDIIRLAGHLRSLYTLLDHGYLNEVPGLEEATSERLCGWIWQRLSEWIDDLEVVVVQETDTARCIYHGK